MAHNAEILDLLRAIAEDVRFLRDGSREIIEQLDRMRAEAARSDARLARCVRVLNSDR